MEEAPEISVIVPTLREAQNLPLLVPKIDQALAGRRYELLILDDNSLDDTVGVCAQLAQRYPLQLIVRKTPYAGLGGAVLQGMAAARGTYLAVMDADLQHPPERLADLIDPLKRDEADFVLGSRYVPGGSTQMRWGLLRRINSKIATLLARPFAGSTRDPMSGFFALRRQTYLSARRLTPLGYKIALELMCKCQVGRVREVPIHFALRAHGQSKLTLREQFRYLEHLSRLYDFTYPRASPMLKFVIATAAAWFVGLGAVVALRDAQVPLAQAVGWGYGGALAALCVFHARYVRTQREFLLTQRPWLDFAVSGLCEWTAAAAVARWLTRRLAGPTAGEVFVASFAAATMVRYVLRKELMQDIRGLRRDARSEELRP